MSPPSKTDVELLKASGLFDEEWYRATYPDVAMLRMDPAQHYLRYGRHLGRVLADGEQIDISILKKLQELPAPKKGHTLMEANEICLSGNDALGLAYARKHLPEEFSYTMEILRANAALRRGDEAAWLRHLNAYLANFDVAPVQLGDGDTLFDRFKTASLRAVTGGPLISVIMPAYNAEKSVSMAARSILNQTWRNLELLIVDDASEDGTWAVLQEIAASDNRVKITRNTVNVGPYVSKNIAVTQASGEWITGQDADDWAHPSRIAEHVSFCIKAGVRASVGSMLRVADNGEFVRLNKADGFFLDGACRSAFISLMISSTFFREHLGAWDSIRVSGDSEILRRIEAIEGCEVTRLQVPLMLCLDNPAGLTNDPLIGYSEKVGRSEARLEYKRSFTKFHQTALRKRLRLKPFHLERSFPAPEDLIVPADSIKELMAHTKLPDFSHFHQTFDICMITDLKFPGGNTSSTLEEYRFLKERGLSVKLIHCPRKAADDERVNEKFRPFLDDVLYLKSVDYIKPKVVIARHPRVVCSDAFAFISRRISCESAFFVINNSVLHSNGGVVYNCHDLFRSIKAMQSSRKILAPISSRIKAELEPYVRDADDIEFSQSNWNPTFNVNTVCGEPKSRLSKIPTIGRHARDSEDKWPEDPTVLAAVYPDSPKLKILHMGGDSVAVKIVGERPENWMTLPFGSLDVSEYLSRLDVFVYFPHSRYKEAFGRTIAEAMLACVPVILPRSFEETFGDLAIYCEPGQVSDIVQALARDDATRIAYLSEVQALAIDWFSSRVIMARLAGSGLFPITSADRPVWRLSEGGLAYKRSLERVGVTP